MCLQGRKTCFSFQKTLGSWLRLACNKDIFSSVQFSSVTQWCPTLCDPMNRTMPGLPVKTIISLITCLPSAYIRFSQENLCNSQNGPSYHLKYHFQLKIKEYVGSLRGDQLWEVVRSKKTKAFSADENFQRCVHVGMLSRV